MVWVVPAQAGPRGMCLAGRLPSAWHGEDETPAVDLALAALGPERATDHLVVADWTFSLVVPELSALAQHLADRLGWAEHDLRRKLVQQQGCCVNASCGHRGRFGFAIPRVRQLGRPRPHHVEAA